MTNTMTDDRKALVDCEGCRKLSREPAYHVSNCTWWADRALSAQPSPDAAQEYPSAELMQAWRDRAEQQGLHQKAIGWHLLREACKWQRAQGAASPDAAQFMFEAACSGLRYESPGACGEVAAIHIDGVRYAVSSPDGECGEVALLQPWEEWIEQHAETEPLLLNDWYVPVTKLKEYFAKMHPPADAVSSVQDEETREALKVAIHSLKHNAQHAQDRAKDAASEPDAAMLRTYARLQSDAATALSRLASK